MKFFSYLLNGLQILVLLVLSVAMIFGQKDSIKLSRIHVKDSVSLIIDKSPRNAFYLGLLLPGGGQIYNHRWWKLPLVYGGYYAAFSYLGYSRKQYKTYNGYYQDAINNPNHTVKINPELPPYTLKQIKIVRDKVRDRKDVALFIVIGAHLLIGLEAYVDAHLKNFNMDDNLSLKLSPENGGLALVYHLH